MITNINDTKSNLEIKSGNDAIRILENDQKSNNTKKTELPSLNKNTRSNKSFEGSESSIKKANNRQNSNETCKQNIKNYAEIRNCNRTINRLVSVSLKNLDLKKILEREKIEEIKKFNIIERLLHGGLKNNHYERIFEKDPLADEKEKFIKNRNHVKIRNKKLSMNNLLLGVQKSPDYIVKNIKKAPNVYDLNNNIKLRMLEKDVEMQRKYLNEANALRSVNNNNNNINQNKNGNFNNNFNSNNNINFNNFENNFTNTHITITNQTNFLKETINSILDESLSTHKNRSKNKNNNNNKDNELENNFFPEGKKKINFDFDELDDNVSKSSAKKNSNFNSAEQSNKNKNSGKKQKNKLHNFGYLSSSESEDYEKNMNYNTYRNLSKNNFNKNKQNTNSDIDESSIFDIKSDLKSLENKKEKKNSNNLKKSAVDYSSSNFESSKNQIKPSNDKSKITRKSIILLDQNAGLNLKKIDKEKLIQSIYDINSQRKIEENKNKNNNKNDKNDAAAYNTSDKNTITDEDTKSAKTNSEATSEHFIDEDKIQKLDDSGVLKPVKYESVYFKSLKKIQGENNLPNPARLNPAEISLVDIEPQHKTKKEIEKVKNSIKDIMKRRFDFNDEYLNDLHKKLQKKLIDVDPNYESVKNKYAQYSQQKILGKKEFETAMELHVMNKNPIMQVNNMVTFPMIINDPMLLASIYNVNMFNLEYTNNQIK